MPTLPTEFDLGARPTPQPSADIVPIRMGMEARAVENVGDAITQVNEHLTTARRATDLTNALAGATRAIGEKEIAYQRDPDYKTIPGRFQADAGAIQQQFSQGIRDPVVLREFNNAYTKLATSKQLAVTLTATKQEADDNKGQLDLALEDIAQQYAYSDPAGRAALENLAMVHIGEKEQARWITHVEAAQSRLKFGKRVDEVTVERGIDDDPIATWKSLRDDPSFAPRVTGLTRQRYVSYARRAAWPQEVRQDADRAMQSISAPEAQVDIAADPAQFVRDIRMAEASPAGTVSPKGAKGVMQVLDATNYNPGFGVKPAANDSPEERQRVGEDYAKAMLTRYNGNRTLAGAAYNAGPGQVDKWVEKFGDPRTGEISDAEFAAKIPFAETKGYVQRISAPISQAAGMPATAKDIRAQLPTAIVAAEKSAEETHPGDLQYRDAVVQQVRNNIAVQAGAINATQQQATSYLLGVVNGGGGKPPIVDRDMLLSDPQARRAYFSLDLGSMAGIDGHIERNARTAAAMEDKASAGAATEITRRMYLPDSDQNKVSSISDLLPFLAEGGKDGVRINLPTFDALKRELTDAATPEGHSFNVDRDREMNRATRRIAATPAIAAMGEFGREKILDAQDRMLADFDARRRAMREGGKDPRALLREDSPDYFFTPANVKSYIGTGKDAVAQRAASDVAASPEDRASLVAQARAALASGAQRPAVEARLKKFGIDASELDAAAPKVAAAPSVRTAPVSREVSPGVTIQYGDQQPVPTTPIKVGPQPANVTIERTK